MLKQLAGQHNGITVYDRPSSHFYKEAWITLPEDHKYPAAVVIINLIDFSLTIQWYSHDGIVYQKAIKEKISLISNPEIDAIFDTKHGFNVSELSSLLLGSFVKDEVC